MPGLSPRARRSEGLTWIERAGRRIAKKEAAAESVLRRGVFDSGPVVAALCGLAADSFRTAAKPACENCVTPRDEP